MSDSVNTQLNTPVSDQGRQGPIPYHDQTLLERCYRVLEIDHRIEKLRSEEIRRLYLGEGPRLAMPAPEAGSQSAAQPEVAPLSGSSQAVLAPIPRPDDLAWFLRRPGVSSTLRRLELPSDNTPFPSLSGTRANGIREAGDQSRHGLGDTPQRHGRRTDVGPPYDANDDTESRTAPAITPASNGSGRRESQRGREPVPGRFHPYRGMAPPAVTSQTSGEPRSDPPSSTRANVAPAPAIAPLRVGNHRFQSPAAIRTFFCKEGLDVSPLTRQDHTLALVTPDVTSKRFTALFGGSPGHERPRSVKRNIVCINREAQPYAPTSPGEAGLLFVAPNTVLLEDSCKAFHIFVCRTTLQTGNLEKCYRYFGTYTKVPTTRTTLGVDEWYGLPAVWRNIWSKRIIASGARGTGDILARVSIRNERPNGPPPSLDDIDQWLEDNLGQYENIPNRIVRAALDSGEENIKFEVVKCVRYDLEIVKKLQEKSGLSEGTSC